MADDGDSNWLTGDQVRALRTRAELAERALTEARADEVRALRDQRDKARQKYANLSAALSGSTGVERGYTWSRDVQPRRLDPHPRTAQDSPTHERTVYYGPWRQTVARLRDDPEPGPLNGAALTGKDTE